MQAQTFTHEAWLSSAHISDIASQQEPPSILRLNRHWKDPNGKLPLPANTQKYFNEDCKTFHLYITAWPHPHQTHVWGTNRKESWWKVTRYQMLYKNTVGGRWGEGRTRGESYVTTPKGTRPLNQWQRAAHSSHLSAKRGGDPSKAKKKKKGVMAKMKSTSIARSLWVKVNAMMMEEVLLCFYTKYMYICVYSTYTAYILHAINAKVQDCFY